MLEGRYLTADEATILFRRWLDDKGASSETRLRFVRRTDKAPQRTRRNSEQAG
jgi:hypothetical protein